MNKCKSMNKVKKLFHVFKNESSLIFNGESISPPKTIYTFELLRFVAAFFTFFGHYVHFFMWQQTESRWFNDINPDIGALAVPSFFMLSGAIFAHTYGNSLSVGKTTFLSFAKKRFARLYPLHILTLLLVLLLQAIVWNKHSHYFIYQLNDLEHFIMQIFFISNWTIFEGGPSYNGPIWSVSHEVFLYFCFFIFFYLSSKIKSKNLFILGCYLAVYFLNPAMYNIYDSNGPFRYSYMFKSLFTFMTGVFIYQVYRVILRYDWKGQALLSLLFIYGLTLASSQFLLNGIPYGYWGPTTIFILLMVNTYFKLDQHPKIHRQFFELGNLTYSSYLLHFPIQLVMLIFSDYVFKLNFADQSIFALYLVIVLISSYFISKYYELPMKDLILNKKLKL